MIGGEPLVNYESESLSVRPPSVGLLNVPLMLLGDN